MIDAISPVFQNNHPKTTIKSIPKPFPDFPFRSPNLSTHFQDVRMRVITS